MSPKSKWLSLKAWSCTWCVKSENQVADNNECVWVCEATAKSRDGILETMSSFGWERLQESYCRKKRLEMDWLTTATESQWQREEMRMPGGLTAKEDFHSEPEQSLLLLWLLTFYWILVPYVGTRQGTLGGLHWLIMCLVDNEGQGRVLEEGQGAW